MGIAEGCFSSSRSGFRLYLGQHRETYLGDGAGVAQHLVALLEALLHECGLEFIVLVLEGNQLLFLSDHVVQLLLLDDAVGQVLEDLVEDGVVLGDALRAGELAGLLALALGVSPPPERVRAHLLAAT